MKKFFADFFETGLREFYRARIFIKFLGWAWIVLSAMWLFIFFGMYDSIEGLRVEVLYHAAINFTWGFLHLAAVKYLEKRYAGS